MELKKCETTNKNMSDCNFPDNFLIYKITSIRLYDPTIASNLFIESETVNSIQISKYNQNHIEKKKKL